MSLRVYKTVKATTQLLAVAAGIYSISLGADPMTTFGLIAAVVSGPEVMEYLVNQDTQE